MFSTRSSFFRTGGGSGGGSGLPLTGGTLSGQLNFSGTTHAGIKLLSLNTTQRNALTAAAGMLIYNTTTGNIEAYDGSSWLDLGAAAAGGDMLAATYDPGAVGGDAFDMDNMVEGTTTKILTDTERSKLAGIEAGADVTDATNVDAAGATMNTDTNVSGNGWVVDEDNMASDSATKVPTQQSVKAYVDAITPPAKLLPFLAGSFYLPTTNPAPPERDTGTFGFLYRNLFDDTTQEYVHGLFVVPDDIGTGNVTFRAFGYAVTAAASKNIQLSFEHSARADAESWDAAYTAEDSGDLAIDSTQDQLDVFTWTETVANLGWAAGDIVRYKLSRKAPGSNNLTGDWGLNLFTISIPRV